MHIGKLLLSLILATTSAGTLQYAALAENPLVIPGEYANGINDTWDNAQFTSAPGMPMLLHSDLYGGAAALIYAEKFNGYENLKAIPQGKHTFTYTPVIPLAFVQTFLLWSYETPKGKKVTCSVIAYDTVTQVGANFSFTANTNLSKYRDADEVPKDAINPKLVGIMDLLWNTRQSQNSGESQTLLSNFAINGQALNLDLQDNINGYKQGFFYVVKE